MSPKKTPNLDLQDQYFSAIQKQKIPVQIFLVNGIRLVGQLEAFDTYIVLLKNEGNYQGIYKHAISTVVPIRQVELVNAQK